MFSTLLNKSDNLTKGDKKVQKYILENPNRIEMLTINKLAANAGVSVATAQRFCQKIGFSGYKDFKNSFVAELVTKNNKNNETGKIAINYLQKYQKIIEQLKGINENELKELADSLASKYTNYILGVYYSGVPAQLLTLQLQDLGLDTVCADDYTKGEHILENANPNSTIVLFSINGTKTHSLSFFGDAIKQSRNSFLITLNQKPEIAKIFKHTIILPGNDLNRTIPFDAQSITTIFIEILSQIIYQNQLK